MKSGGLKPFWPNTLDIHFGLPFSSSCHNGTCNESDESDEGRSHEVGRCNDADSGTCICCRDQWIEDKAGQGSCLGPHGCCLRPDQEERKLQVGRHAQHEVEEEASKSSQERHQPFHQGTLRVQGKTCLQNREGVCNEEVEGGIELSISIQCLLQLLHCIHLHGFGGRFCLEHARFLGERVDAFLGWTCWLLLQLHVEHATQLKASILLDLIASHCHESFNNSLGLFCLQSIGLSNSCNYLSLCHCTSRLHGCCLHCFHFFHCFHCRCHHYRKKKMKDKTSQRVRRVLSLRLHGC